MPPLLFLGVAAKGKLKQLFAVNQDRNWSIVNQLHLHHLPEATSGNFSQFLPKFRTKEFIQGFRNFRRRSVDP